MFVLPAGPCTLIGTTETETHETPDQVRATRADVIIATQAANIARARALPLHHPDYPGTVVPGVVTVVVVPDSDDPRPQPSEGTLRTVVIISLIVGLGVAVLRFFGTR